MDALLSILHARAPADLALIGLVFVLAGLVTGAVTAATVRRCFFIGLFALGLHLLLRPFFWSPASGEV